MNDDGYLDRTLAAVRELFPCCVRCGQHVSAGVPARLARGGTRIQHVSCPRTQTETTAPGPVAA